MEFTDQGMKLERVEADNLASVLNISLSMIDWNNNWKEMFAMRYMIEDTLRPSPENSEADQVIVPSEYLSRLASVASFAIANPEQLLDQYCRPSAVGCGGYLPQMEPSGKKALDDAQILVSYHDSLSIEYPESE